MRIVFFSDNFFPEISGISDSIITTGETLRAKGHEVVYVAPSYPKRAYLLLKGPAAEKAASHESRLSLPVRRLPSLPLPNSPTGQSRIVIPLGTSTPYLRRFRPDVIHTQSPFGVGLEALLASRVLGVPLVGTNHTPIEEFLHYTPFGGPLGTKLARAYFNWYYNKCVFMTAPFAGLITRMREMGLHVSAKAEPNPTSLELFTPASHTEKEGIRKTLGIPGPALLYVGRLAPEKQVDHIIDALARLTLQFPTLTLVITGHGTAEPALRAQAHKLGVADRVRFTGFVSEEQLIKLYRASDVFVLMSVAETQSLALMQAYASGIPAVVARAGALPDYTPPECGFVVEPTDTVALTEHLATLLADDVLRERMGNSAHTYVQQFAPTTIALEWERIYSEAASVFSSSRNRSRIERVKK